MKLRRTAIVAILVLAQIVACGNDDNPTGGDGSGTGENTPTTAIDDGY